MTAVKHSETESAIRRDARGDRAAGSFLVRVWYESREIAEKEPSFRAYIRNLQTGEEHFVGDPDRVGERLVRQIVHDVGNPSDPMHSRRPPVAAEPSR